MGSCRTTKDVFRPLDSSTFAQESKRVIDFISDYYNDIEKCPVQSLVNPGYLSEHFPDSAPYAPEPLETILKEINTSIIPGLTHWQSPNFFAYFQANASNAGFLGEMLCSGLNVVGFNWISSPAATELESIVMDWLGKMLKLPSCFLFSGRTGGGGVIHGSACESMVCTLAAARDKVLNKIGFDKITKLVVYASDQTHFSLQKASKLIGIPPSNFRCLKTSHKTGFALSPESLYEAIETDIKSGFIPLYLCATVGTTACGAVDPIEALGKLAQKYDVWFHIDAAYAGSACICPEHRHYLDGVELADSFCINTHKWLLTNMECSCLWVKDSKSLIDSLSTKPEILSNSATKSNRVIDYKDWQIALSRRFRAMKLWVVIKRYGVANLMQHIRSDVNMAGRFEAMIRMDKMFEVEVPRRFALVCFRLKPDNESNGSELNRRLLDSINSSGHAFMTHAVLEGKFVIRCAIGGTLTEDAHIDKLWKLIKEKAELLLLHKP